VSALADGFQDAQRRLRAETGIDATFHIPGTPTWPTGTKLDPETGRPYDPVIQPEDDSGDETDVPLKVGKAVGSLNDDNDSPIGIMSDAEGVLMVDVDDVASVASATEVTISNVRYKITQKRPRGLTRVMEWLFFVEAK
jgi:hypothetical protein